MYRISAVKPGNYWLCLPAIIGLVHLETTSSAASITVFNTGVNASGQVLSGGSADPHFIVVGTTTQGTNQPAVVLSSLFFQWVPDSSSSAWIGWIDNPFPGNYQNYTLRETFNLSGFNPSTAVLTGSWAADQFGSIVLNGTPTGVSVPDGNWNSSNNPNLTPFTISSGFVNGVNTLDFAVDFADGFDGLRVSNLTLTATPNAVPEPSALGLFGLGLTGLLVVVVHRGTPST